MLRVQQVCITDVAGVRLSAHGRLMKLSMSTCTRVVVPIVTRVTFLIYACLAGASFHEAKKIFDKDGMGPGEGMRTLKVPIIFCSMETTSQRSASFIQVEGRVQSNECMDATLVANIVPVTAVLSLAAICIYVLMDLVVRGRARCCRAMGGVSSGVAAGFGAALSILLFQSMWGFMTVAFICDHYEKTYAKVLDAEYEGQRYNLVLAGNSDIIWATGVAAVLSCVLSAIDAAIIFRASRSAVPASARGNLGSSGGAPAAASDAARVVVAGGKESKPRWKPGLPKLGGGRAGKKCKTGVDQQATGDVEAPQQEHAPAGANPFLSL